MQSDVFAALADPTRRHLFRQLAVGGPLTATALASDMSISRQAVSKHLGVLADAGMATSSRHGRETRYQAQPDRLGEVEEWIESVQGQWQLRLGALADSIAAKKPEAC